MSCWNWFESVCSFGFGFLMELNDLRQFVCPGMSAELVSSNGVKVSSTQGSNRAAHGDYTGCHKKDLQLKLISNPF